METYCFKIKNCILPTNLLFFQDIFITKNEKNLYDKKQVEKIFSDS